MVIGIDLGSNTIRAALMNEDFGILQSVEFIVGSARGLKMGGKLDYAAKKRIFSALKNIKDEFKFDKFPHIAVATEAFRIAKDSTEFFKQIQSKFGIKFEIIDGKSEAKFVDIAVRFRLKTLGKKLTNLLIVDLGGASTEVAFNRNYRSFKFGIIRFHNEFLTFENMQKNADIVTKEAREFILNLDVENIVLTSGVPTTIVALNLGLDYANYEASLINGQRLKFEDFQNTFKYITSLDDKEAAKKVGENRAVYIAGATFLLNSLLQEFKEREFLVVDDGLREGILIDKIRKIKEKR